jgi:hypothetical protein
MNQPRKKVDVTSKVYGKMDTGNMSLYLEKQKIGQIYLQTREICMKWEKTLSLIRIKYIDMSQTHLRKAINTSTIVTLVGAKRSRQRKKNPLSFFHEFIK